MRKEKRTFKKWVVNFLLILNFILIFYLSGDCENLTYFIVCKTIALSIFLFNNYMLYKHSDLFEDN
ncbi:MAG: hypothetical protein RRY22_04990 [Bacilli bacterium]